ncbi:Lysine 6-dehydrogenase [bacterium HR16]|nr:Lysine 6-dehydrogenase [bacterium HR16]
MDTPTIGILGGYGGTGKHIVRLLLEYTDAHLVIAGRQILRARQFAKECNEQTGKERVCATYAHAADPESVMHAFDGAQLLIVASPTGRFTEETATAALEAGCDWLDIQYHTPKLAVLNRLAQRIEEAGRCFVTDAGLHPGLPALLVRYAASCLDVLEAANVSAVFNLQGGFPRTPSLYEFTRELMRSRCGVYRDGQWRFFSGLGAGETRQADFGFGFGMRLCAPVMLEEMQALPEMFPALRETGFYIAGFNWFVDWVVMPLLWLSGRVAPRLWVKPMAQLLYWGTRLYANPPYGAVVKLEACGWQDGRRQVLSLQLYHPDPYLFTAIAAVAGVLQYLRGHGRRAGLWLAGHLYNPQEALRDIQTMGVKMQQEISPIQGICPFCEE